MAPLKEFEDQIVIDKEEDSDDLEEISEPKKKVKLSEPEK